jgi:hypothetical protein
MMPTDFVRIQPCGKRPYRKLLLTRPGEYTMPNVTVVLDDRDIIEL